MYLSILIFPLLGSFVSGFLGRKIGVTGAHIITCTCLIISSILATLAFYEVGLCGSPVSVNLSTWLESEILSVQWEFLFDQLTVSMFIPVLYISSLIHIFSTNYMAEDPALCFGKTHKWVKLSNSGDTLKLMIPSYSRKAISGQNNYLGMVTSHKMTENEMGYRGSKSEFIKQNPEPNIINSVKEQRVDGGYCNKLLQLRYTLMGLERGYQVKIPSNQINKQNYSTFSNTNLSNSSLNPWFITGFTDAEGSFKILILKDTKNKTNWTVKTRFTIGLHKKDTAILELIKSYFGGIGTISPQSKDSVQYRVGSLKEISDIIIPHFDKYPLITKKKADFILFKQIVSLINNKEHLTIEGLQKILSIKGSLNLGLSLALKTNFPNIISIERPMVSHPEIIEGNWISGFTSGEGCFHIRIKPSPKYKLGAQVSLLFKISQHERDKELMKSFIDYFNCGSISKNSTWIDYTVVKQEDLLLKIIPFFDKYQIVGVKHQDFLDFKKVAELIRVKDHLTTSGLNKIKLIKEGMNKGR